MNEDAGDCVELRMNGEEEIDLVTTHPREKKMGTNWGLNPGPSEYILVGYSSPLSYWSPALVHSRHGIKQVFV